MNGRGSVARSAILSSDGQPGLETGAAARLFYRVRRQSAQPEFAEPDLVTVILEEDAAFLGAEVAGGPEFTGRERGLPFRASDFRAEHPLTVEPVFESGASSHDPRLIPSPGGNRPRPGSRSDQLINRRR